VRSLGRPRRKWVDKIMVHLLELGWGSVDWIGLAQNRDKWRAFVNVVMNFRCKILGFHGTDYEELCLLGWYAVWLL
jgi:hypothetical protein